MTGTLKTAAACHVRSFRRGTVKFPLTTPQNSSYRLGARWGKEGASSIFIFTIRKKPGFIDDFLRTTEHLEHHRLHTHAI